VPLLVAILVTHGPKALHNYEKKNTIRRISLLDTSHKIRVLVTRVVNKRKLETYHVDLSQSIKCFALKNQNLQSLSGGVGKIGHIIQDVGH
jgi:hypothetical protein